MHYNNVDYIDKICYYIINGGRYYAVQCIYD